VTEVPIGRPARVSPSKELLAIGVDHRRTQPSAHLAASLARLHSVGSLEGSETVLAGLTPSVWAVAGQVHRSGHDGQRRALDEQREQYEELGTEEEETAVGEVVPRGRGRDGASCRKGDDAAALAPPQHHRVVLLERAAARLLEAQTRAAKRSPVAQPDRRGAHDEHAAHIRPDRQPDCQVGMGRDVADGGGELVTDDEEDKALEDGLDQLPHG